MTVPCAHCKGTGRIARSMKQKPLWWEIKSYRCHVCRGTGLIIEPARKPA